MYNALINTIHKYHGSVISFSGDAITCWFDSENNSQPHGLEALTCVLALHKAMQGFRSVPTPSGMIFSLGIKVAAATGSVQRYLVGDPDIQVIEVFAGKTLDNLADTEKHAQRGEVLAHASVLDSIGARIETYQTLHLTEPSCYMIKGIDHPAPERPWPKLPPNALTDERCRYWLL